MRRKFEILRSGKVIGLDRKVVGLEGIHIEVWKCTSDVGVNWLSNQILKIRKMPDERE